MFVVDPRVPDEEVVALTEDTRALIESQGAKVTRELSWGKRKLAYPIAKLTEGKYQLLNIETEGVNPFPEVEQRLRQNERVLRYLNVRVDDGRLRLPEGAEGPAVAPEPPAEAEAS
jgi:small subunit ribosomal protein S6